MQPFPRLPRALAAACLAVPLLGAGCSPVAPTTQTTTAASKPRPEPRNTSVQLPIGPDDPASGNDDALVTLVAFLDFECRYCRRGHEILTELRNDYSNEELRIVFKHYPLGFHERALPAATAAQAVFVLAGSEAFFEYEAELFESTSQLSEQQLPALAEDLEINRQDFERVRSTPRIAKKVDADRQLARRLGIEGVPAFSINGLALEGAKTKQRFELLIEYELDHARRLVAAGHAPASVFQLRLDNNLPRASVNYDRELSRHRVELLDSPSLGPADAPVTIVEFSDFECPYCARVRPTLDHLMTTYESQVRLVFKHNPLPFHEQAMGTHLLAEEVHRRQGPARFWQLARELFAQRGQLGASELERIASEFGIGSERFAAIEQAAEHRAIIRRDQELASELDAGGTPHFFINGFRVRGAETYETFAELVESELEVTRQLIDAQGVAPSRVYERLMQAAVKPPPPAKVPWFPPTEANPAQGPANAPVVVQIFSDFECGYCGRVMPTLSALRQLYPDQVRLVWRHFPLQFHRRARPAAWAAIEAKRQAGDDAFWTMTDRLYFSEQGDDRLSRDVLLHHAQELNLDLDEFQAALDDGRHDELVEHDMLAGVLAGIEGTPGFVVNGYPLFGARPLADFKRLVRFALDELDSTAPAPATRSQPAAQQHTSQPRSSR